MPSVRTSYVCVYLQLMHLWPNFIIVFRPVFLQELQNQNASQNTLHSIFTLHATSLPSEQVNFKFLHAISRLSENSDGWRFLPRMRPCNLVSSHTSPKFQIPLPPNLTSSASLSLFRPHRKQVHFPPGLAMRGTVVSKRSLPPIYHVIVVSYHCTVLCRQKK